MKRFLLAFFIVLGSLGLKAQWVSIPDTVLGTWLDTSGYSACMQGNNTVGWEMDTTCNEIVSATYVYIRAVGLNDLTGIQYFDNATYLYFRSNHIAYLPALPPILIDLDVIDNDLTVLPTLPSTLQNLICRANNLTSLPVLPPGLIHLDCVANSLNQLPALPATLISIDCTNNHIPSIPSLPAGLLVLACGGNPLGVLPVLNANLQSLDCRGNQLTGLPELPASLAHLDCSLNYITALPELPSGLVALNCYTNQLSLLPELPDSLFQLYCYGNPHLRCLPQLKRIVNLRFDAAYITCLPGYGNVTNSIPSLASVPLCGIFNNSGCRSFSNVNGKVIYDADIDCLLDSTESGFGNVKLNLYENGVLQQQAYTGGDGYYSFETANGNYAIQADNFTYPFVITCPSGGFDTAVISATDSISYNNNFAVKCLTQGFDVGVASAVRDSGLFRPANYALVQILAGDLSNRYGAHCAAGVAGQVQVSFSGPIGYQGYAAGALTPDVVSGNTITWNISDFGTVNYSTAFHLRFKTDTTAQAHQAVSFAVSVSPTSGDVDTSNNNMIIVTEIIVPYDPNIKEVSPIADIDTAQEWLNYTIHFQNTGTAEAQHVYVDDTLDTDLDASSFQLLGYSHQPLVQIKQNTVRFNFPNINLPDSNTNEPLSHGYVQYKIKLKENLPIGTTINNTAFIYFDFNAPVVTNTTTNTIVTATGVSEIRGQKSEIRLYPNPTNTILNIQTEKFNPVLVSVFDINGKKILEQKYTPQIDVSLLTSGIYFIELKSNDAIARKKFVKM